MRRSLTRTAVAGSCAALALSAHDGRAYELPRATPAGAGLNETKMDALKARMHALVDSGRRAGIV